MLQLQGYLVGKMMKHQNIDICHNQQPMQKHDANHKSKRTESFKKFSMPYMKIPLFSHGLGRIANVQCLQLMISIVQINVKLFRLLREAIQIKVIFGSILNFKFPNL